MTAALTPEAAHSDDLAVDRFAVAMKAKLAKKRADGRHGWDGPECSAEILSRLLREHVEKGDPLDVGALAMMLHQRGEQIASEAAQVVRRTGDLTDADYDRAIGILVRTKRASTSLIQRDIGIGYNAAAKLMERAEADGFVSRPNEVGKREVMLAAPAPGIAEAAYLLGFMASSDDYNGEYPDIEFEQHPQWCSVRDSALRALSQQRVIEGGAE